MQQISHSNDDHSSAVTIVEPVRTNQSGKRFSSHEEDAYKLKKFVDEIEKFESQKSAISEAIKATYDAASADGFKKKALKQTVTDRQKDQQELDIFNENVSALKAMLDWAEKNPRWKKAV